MLPKLEVIRLVGVKLCSPSQEADEEPQPVGEEIKREVSTTVLSLHEKIEHLQTIIQLQTLRCVCKLATVVLWNNYATCKVVGLFIVSFSSIFFSFIHLNHDYNDIKETRLGSEISYTRTDLTPQLCWQSIKLAFLGT